MTPAILDVLKKNDFKSKTIHIEDVVFASPLNTAIGGKMFCAESGGPEAGSGCAGKGVTEAIKTPTDLEVHETLELDTVLYDVLGDVVCGGFSMPIKRGHAKEIYIVTSGEIQALFSACNISRAVIRFADRTGARLGGIIANLRNMENERELLLRFAERIYPIHLGSYETCKYLADEFEQDVQFIEIPAGIEGTSNFLRAVADRENCQSLHDLVAQEELRVAPELEKIKAKFAAEKVRMLLVSGPANEMSLGKQVSHVVPYFVRTFAVKKMHEGSEKLACERGSRVTVSIVRESAESFTPARFKAKFAAIFDAAELEE